MLSDRDLDDLLSGLVDKVDTLSRRLADLEKQENYEFGVSVEQFGAIGDGVVDDTAAINAAIAAASVNLSHSQTLSGRARVLLKPGKPYLITGPLNMCNMQGIHLDGGAPGFGALLIGKMASTECMIECIGSTNITFTNLQLWGDDTNTPAAGIFISRSTVGPNSHTINYDNIQFSGYFTETAVYIVESESNYFDRCNWFLYGDTDATNVTLSRSNVLSLTPTYATLANKGYGLWNINFNRCQMPNFVGRPVYIYDSSGSVYFRDGYMATDTYPIIEMEGGGYIYANNIGCEGQPHETIKLTYNAGIASSVVVLTLDGFTWGSPTDYSIYADDNVILQSSSIINSPCSKQMRLWAARYCNFQGLMNYNAAVFDILFDSATGGYSQNNRFRLGDGDTITFSGSDASAGDLVEDCSSLNYCTIRATYFKVGAGATIQGLLTGTATWDVGSLNDGQTATYDLAITGVPEDGNWVCLASLSSLGAGWAISAYPKWGNNVHVVLTNHTGGTVDLASGTLRVVAMKVI